MIETIEVKDEAVERIMSAKRVKVEVYLYEPFYNFIKEYLAYFGSKQTVEDFARQTVYDTVKLLYNEIHEFVSDKHRLLSTGEWFDKWPHLGCVSCPDEEEE